MYWDGAVPFTYVLFKGYICTKMAEMTLVTKSMWPAEYKPLTVCVLQRKFALPWSAVPVTHQGVSAVPAEEDFSRKSLPASR